MQFSFCYNVYILKKECTFYEKSTKIIHGFALKTHPKGNSFPFGNPSFACSGLIFRPRRPFRGQEYLAAPNNRKKDKTVFVEGNGTTKRDLSRIYSQRDFFSRPDRAQCNRVLRCQRRYIGQSQEEPGGF